MMMMMMMMMNITVILLTVGGCRFVYYMRLIGMNEPRIAKVKLCLCQQTVSDASTCNNAMTSRLWMIDSVCRVFSARNAKGVFGGHLLVVCCIAAYIR